MSSAAFKRYISSAFCFWSLSRAISLRNFRSISERSSPSFPLSTKTLLNSSSALRFFSFSSAICCFIVLTSSSLNFTTCLSSLSFSLTALSRALLISAACSFINRFVVSSTAFCFSFSKFSWILFISADLSRKTCRTFARSASKSDRSLVLCLRKSSTLLLRDGEFPVSLSGTGMLEDGIFAAAILHHTTISSLHLQRSLQKRHLCCRKKGSQNLIASSCISSTK